MDGGQRDGTEAGTAAMLYAGAITGVALRGTTWVLSAFTIGPLLGLADTLAGEYHDRRGVLFAQAVVTVAAVVAAVMAGLGLQTDPARCRRPVRLLGTLFILDALLYLTPIVFAAAMDFVELTTAGWALFGVVVLGNLGLAGLSLLIIVRTRRVRTAAPPAGAIALT
jgi:predicted transporter